MNVTFEFGQNSTVGKRKNQEDAAQFVPHLTNSLSEEAHNANANSSNGALAVLADGMGGHVAGATASKTACSAFVENFHPVADADTFILRNGLEIALHASNNSLNEQIQSDKTLDGMGCTLIGAYFNNSRMHWVSVGDSVLYLYRNGQLTQLNENHSLVPVLELLVEKGEISADEAADHPERNALRSALTGEKIDLIDLPHHQYGLQSGDFIILASDGLLSLSQDQIQDIVEHDRVFGSDAVANALIRAVDEIDLPNQDNTTSCRCPPRLPV